MKAHGKYMRDLMAVSWTEKVMGKQQLTKVLGVDKRGVIVYIYPYNNNIAELAALENGDFGTYYK